MAKEVKVAENAPVNKNVEKKYSLEMLCANSFKLFGITSSTFRGATASVEKRDYSVSEVSEIVKSWKKKEVKK